MFTGEKIQNGLNILKAPEMLQRAFKFGGKNEIETEYDPKKRLGEARRFSARNNPESFLSHNSARADYRSVFVEFLRGELEKLESEDLKPEELKVKKAELINFLKMSERLELIDAMLNNEIENLGNNSEMMRKLINNFLEWYKRKEDRKLKEIRIPQNENPGYNENAFDSDLASLVRKISSNKLENWKEIKNLEFSKIGQKEILQNIAEVMGEYGQTLGDKVNPNDEEKISDWVVRIIRMKNNL